MGPKVSCPNSEGQPVVSVEGTLLGDPIGDMNETR